MIQLRTLASVGLVALIAGCATTPSSTALSTAQTEAVCAMANDVVWHPFGTVSWEDSPQKAATLLAIAPEEQFSQLPRRIRCEGRKITLNNSNGTPFDTYWVSQDGMQAAISGGWHGGELLGGGGICYFSKTHSMWIRQGCVATWAI